MSRVTVEELRRAWLALCQGEFRDPEPWPASTVPTVRVLGCHGGAGASTLALTVAHAAAGPVLVVDGHDASRSGLLGAGQAELGSRDGWVISSRGDVRIARPSPDARVMPPPLGDAVMVVLDADGDAPYPSTATVLVAAATVPALRRLETLLSDGGTAAVAVRGERGWAKALQPHLGTATRAALEEGRVVTVPHDRYLAVHGPDPRDMPQPLVAAAARLLQILPSTGDLVRKDLL